jgi:CcmD family protein
MQVKNKSTLITLLLMLITSFSYASDGIEMADTMRSEGKIYVVVTVMAIVFTGIAIYLFMLDKKLTRLEKVVKEKQKSQ